MRTVTAVSANYLERIADPASPLYGDYSAYKNKEITRAELIARLPHVAIIGDSLSRNIHISSALETLWRAHTQPDGDWFLNTDPSSTSIYSVFERLEKFTPLVATEYGGIGAMMDIEGERQSFFRRILGTRNFRAQVDQIISARRFPDLILIWIGHNNVDWAWRCPSSEFKNPEPRLHRQTQWFRENYMRQVQRLIARARTSSARGAIVVYGLVDFESFFKARDTAEALRAQNPKLFPRLGADIYYFISMRPDYRQNLIRLVAMVNRELDGMVNQLQTELDHDGVSHVQVRYSDALAKVDLSAVEVIHEVDGWHPSTEGHNRFAEAAFRGLLPSLQFLGLNR